MKKQLALFNEVFCFGWEKTRQHAWFIFLTFIIAAIITSAVGRTRGLGAIVDAMLLLSLTSLSLLIVRNHDFTFRDLYTPLLSPKRVINFIILFVLYFLVAAFGLACVGSLIISQANNTAAIFAFIFLVIPGLYIASRTMLFPFIVVEHENTKILDLIKMSYTITRRHCVAVVCYFILVVALTVLISKIAPVLLLLLAPVVLLSSATLYLRLKEHHAS